MAARVARMGEFPHFPAGLILLTSDMARGRSGLVAKFQDAS